MSSKNAIRVQRHRLLKGNQTHIEKYTVLRTKYGVDSRLANKMKFWSVDRILNELERLNIRPLKSLKEADRL